MASQPKSAKKQTIIRVKISGLTARLLPGAKHYASSPPPNWRCWSRPQEPETIDDAVTELIARRRSPKLKSRAALQAAGIECPYWYARAYVVAAIDTALSTAEEAQDLHSQTKGRIRDMLAKRESRSRQGFPSDKETDVIKNRHGENESLSTIVKLLSDAPKKLSELSSCIRMIALLQPALDAAVRVNPQSLHTSSLGQGDKLLRTTFALGANFMGTLIRLRCADHQRIAPDISANEFS